MNFIKRTGPVWKLAVGVFIIIGFLFAGILGLCGWDWIKFSAWLSIDISLSLISLLWGYLSFPSAIISIAKEKDDDKDPERLTIMIDGKEMTLKKNTLPQQFKIFLHKRGEYSLYCRAEFDRSKFFNGNINLHDPIAHTEITIKE